MVQTLSENLRRQDIKRAINAHMTTLIVIFNMYAMHLLKDHQDISSEIENPKSSCTDALDGDERLVKIEQLDVRQKSPCLKALRNFIKAVSTLERICELFFA